MKKVALILPLIIISNIAFGQWASGSGVTHTTDNVGIGTASPNAKLDLSGGYGANGEKFLIYNDNSSGALAGTKTGFYLDRFGRPNNVTFLFPTHSSYPGSFILAAKNTSNTVLVPLLTVMGETGNMGISTISPNARLDLGNGYGTQGEKFLIYNDDTSGPLAGTKSGFYLDRFGLTNNVTFIYPTTSANPGSFMIGAKNTTGTTLIPQFTVQGQSGNVGIGTTSPTHKLSVNGNIRAKEIKVETGWSDFVFEPQYNLRSLKETEQFIKENGHLPEIPSAKEVAENGINLGEMNAKLLQKIEELTLHLINLSEVVDSQQKLITNLQSK